MSGIKHIKSILIISLVLVTMITFLGNGESACAAEQSGEVLLDEDNFPDANFRAVLNGFDANEDGALDEAEIESITSLKNLTGISDLTGIKKLYKLQELNCEGNSLTEVDLAGMENLTKVDVSENQIRSLDVSGCTSLKELFAYSNDLTDIDLSGCVALVDLYVDDNALESLDVKACVNLDDLYCMKNNLKQLDLSNNNKLWRIECGENQISSLTLNASNTLHYLEAYDNKLESIDVEGYEVLCNVKLTNNSLTGLSFSGCENLQEVNAANNELETVDLTGCKSLTHIWLGDNRLEKLDVSECVSLTQLSAYRNFLTECTFGENNLLGTVTLFDNRLSSIDVTGLPKLRALDVAANRLKYLDVSKNLDLYSLGISDNQLAYVKTDFFTENRLALLGATGGYNEINVYPAKVDADLQFDLSTIEGFDVSRMSDIQGGTVSGTILKFDSRYNDVTYSYDIKMEDKIIPCAYTFSIRPAYGVDGDGVISVSNEAVCRVVDAESRLVVNDAKITVDGVSYTADREGYIHIPGGCEASNLTVSAENYEKSELYGVDIAEGSSYTVSIWKKGAQSVINSATIKNKSTGATANIMRDVYYIPKADSTSYEIKLHSDAGQVEKYQLLQSGKLISENENGCFTVKSSDFVAEKPIYIRVITSGNVKGCLIKTGLEVTDTVVIHNPVMSENVDEAYPDFRINISPSVCHANYICDVMIENLSPQESTVYLEIRRGSATGELVERVYFPDLDSDMVASDSFTFKITDYAKEGRESLYFVAVSSVTEKNTANNTAMFFIDPNESYTEPASSGNGGNSGDGSNSGAGGSSGAGNDSGAGESSGSNTGNEGTTGGGADNGGNSVYNNSGVIVLPEVAVNYRTHIQDIGWEPAYRSNGASSGTSGRSKRLEAIQMNVSGNPNLGIQYTVHCQNYGWMSWCGNGEVAGTSGEAKRLEAIRIQLTGSDKEKYDIYYRVHAQNIGWMGWAKNGEAAGTAGYAYRLEAIQAVVVKKGEPLNSNIDGISSVTPEAYRNKGMGSTEVAGADLPHITYRTHVQNVGWQDWKYDGQMSGTSGRALRLEGINIKLTNKDYEGSIVYTTHVQNIGWQDAENVPEAWRRDGEMSGTSGRAYRLEAIRIMLTGEMAEHYDVYYRVHCQNIGWMGWAKNGAVAGTSGFSYRLEGIEIKLVKKGQPGPVSSGQTYISR